MVIDLKDISKSKKFKLTLSIIIALAVLLAVFQAGLMVGYGKARFSFGLGDNYYRAFKGDERGGMMRGGPSLGGLGGGMMGGLDRDDFLGAHGAVGKILQINLPNIVVADVQNVEKTILINDSTIVRKFRDEGKKEDLKIDDMVAIIGSPDTTGVITAKLIRILPAPAQMMLSTSTTK